jgi:hypothetical protein
MNNCCIPFLTTISLLLWEKISFQFTHLEKHCFYITLRSLCRSGSECWGIRRAAQFENLQPVIILKSTNSSSGCVAISHFWFHRIWSRDQPCSIPRELFHHVIYFFKHTMSYFHEPIKANSNVFLINMKD